MPKKRLLILANSVKKGGHCIAGREIIRPEARMPYGNWIRPVSQGGEGELTDANCRFQTGKLPKVFDVIDVELHSPEESTSQPENWYIDDSKDWRRIGTLSTQGLPGVYAETPPDLWLAHGERQDRISTTALLAMSPVTSLCLVAVTGFRMVLEWNSFTSRHRRRACFKYGGVDYDFGLTDPEMDNFLHPFPQAGATKKVDHPTGSEKIVCVSLTPPFQGYHYKIVATVLEIAK
jgi:hypothetical protein